MIRTSLLCATLLASPALAQNILLGDLSISDPHTLETAPNAPVAGGYLQIMNMGDSDDRLVGVTVDSEVAGVVELHEMLMNEGVMRMNEIEGGIPLPAGETVTLERGGLHVMFMQLPQGFEKDQSFPATLTFETAGEVEVTFDIRGRGEAGGHGGHGSHGN